MSCKYFDNNMKVDDVMYLKFNKFLNSSDHSYPSRGDLSPQIISEDHICSKSIYMELKLHKYEEIIEKLQKRCTVKTTEINRLRTALKRITLSKTNMNELLQQLKDKNFITDEGHSVLQVNLFTLWGN